MTIKKMMLMQFYTAFLLDETVFPLDLDSLEMARTLVPSLDQGGDVLTVLDWEEVDFMVKQVEASKCQKVVHINSSLGSVLLVCTLADRRLLDVYTF